MTRPTDTDDIRSLTESLRRLREGSLTSAELAQLRQTLDSMPDESLSAAIDGAAAECDPPSPGTLDRLKQRLDRTLDMAGTFGEESVTSDITAVTPRRRWTFLHIWSAVAAVMIPCLLGVMAYLWIGARDNGNGLIAMSTKPLDKAEISLPDGSSVNLRGNSSLSFDSRFGHSGSRTVSLDGQAYFKVAKDAGKSFIVKSPGMDVTVHGTEFSVVSRTGSPYSEVILDNGSVTIDSPSQSITLSPGQTATINRSDGSITVAATSTALKADWATDELTFDNISPDSLIAEIEKAYDIKLSPSITSHIDQRFTGTLPWDDLGLTLDVLRYVYGFDLPYRAEK